MKFIKNIRRIPEILEKITHLEKTMDELSKLPDKLASLSAIDVGFKERGHIIIMCRCGGKDIVRILDIPPEIPLLEYRNIVRFIESKFGARLSYLDTPIGIPIADFMKLYRY